MLDLDRQLVPGQGDLVGEDADSKGLDRGEFDLENYSEPEAQKYSTEKIMPPPSFENCCLVRLDSEPKEGPSSKQTTDFIDETGELFAPKGKLNFSALNMLDEATAVEEIILEGLHTSVSTQNRIKPKVFSPLRPNISQTTDITDCESQLEQHKSPGNLVNKLMTAVVSDSQEGDLPVQTKVSKKEESSRNIKINVPQMSLDRSEDKSPDTHLCISSSSEVCSLTNSLCPLQSVTAHKSVNINNDLVSLIDGSSDRAPLETVPLKALSVVDIGEEQYSTILNCNPRKGGGGPCNEDGRTVKKAITNAKQHVPESGSRIKKGSKEIQNSDVDLYVQGMEEIRSHLQDMLHMSRDNSLVSAVEVKSLQQIGSMPHLLSDEPVLQQHFMEHGPPVSFKPDDGVSELLENFSSFTSHVWSESGNLSGTESSLQAENQHLRVVLEKERYRRKHCEQHIQHLNAKMLEIQQQLAVAVSTDKRKDIMIEQLDKQLAKVVDGWKRKDLEKEERISQLGNEKSRVEETMIKQKQVIEGFEKELSFAVESLHKEKEHSSRIVEGLKEEMAMKEESRLHAENWLLAEQEKNKLMTKEYENIKKVYEQTEMKIQDVQNNLHHEQDEWFKKENELLQKIEEVTEHYKKILMEEKLRSEEQLDINQEVLRKLQSTQTDLKKLEIQMDADVREKESLKVEMSIMEAKHESAKSTLEADLHSQMEREITKQIADVHKRSGQAQQELQTSHQKQIQELNQSHAKDLEEHMAKMLDQMKQQNKEYRKQMQELERKLHKYRNENKELKLTKQESETKRLEILSKLQHMMQSEAVQLLGSMPDGLGYQAQDNTRSTLGSHFSNITQSETVGPDTSSPNQDISFCVTPGITSKVVWNMPVTQMKSDVQQLKLKQAETKSLDQPATDGRIQEYLHSLSQYTECLPLQIESRIGENNFSEDVRFSEFLGLCLTDGENSYSIDNEIEQTVPSYQLQPEPNSLSDKHCQQVITAVHMKPPQQHAASSRQLHSPPTKQSRNQQQSKLEEEKDEMRFEFGETQGLNTEYHNISERVEEYENRQSELQHYIQMLLNRTPGLPVESSEHDNSSPQDFTGRGADNKDKQLTGVPDGQDIQARYLSQNMTEVYRGHTKSPDEKKSLKSPRLLQNSKAKSSLKSRSHLQDLHHGINVGTQNKLIHGKKMERKMAYSTRAGQTKRTKIPNDVSLLSCVLVNSICDDGKIQAISSVLVEDHEAVTLAKGMGNGFPLAAVVTTPEIAQSMGKALHFNTFGGNPMSCAVGSSVLDVIEEDGIQQNSHEVGNFFIPGLRKILDDFEFVGDVRGKGLMIGMEMVTDKKSRNPLPAEDVAVIWEDMKNMGLLVGKGGLYGTAFRIKPPMCLTKEDAAFALSVIRRAMENFQAERC
ncbi:hypothetical protein ScPMuIL_017849 [Solemya velum]